MLNSFTYKHSLSIKLLYIYICLYDIFSLIYKYSLMYYTLKLLYKILFIGEYLKFIHTVKILYTMRRYYMKLYKNII